jgi:hypothetical protein
MMPTRTSFYRLALCLAYENAVTPFNDGVKPRIAVYGSDFSVLREGASLGIRQWVCRGGVRKVNVVGLEVKRWWTANAKLRPMAAIWKERSKSQAAFVDALKDGNKSDLLVAGFIQQTLDWVVGIESSPTRRFTSKRITEFLLGCSQEEYARRVFGEDNPCRPSAKAA